MKRHEKEIELFKAIIRDTKALEYKEARKLIADTLATLSERLFEILEDERDLEEAQSSTNPKTNSKQIAGSA